MKRPLFSLGFSFFITLLIASFLPRGSIFPAAVILGAVFIGFFVLSIRRKLLRLVCLLSFSAFLAFGVKSLFDAAIVTPVRALDSESRRITARVTETSYGYGFDFYYATLQILETDGDSLPSFTIAISSQEELAVDEIITAEASFYDSGLRYAGQGEYIGATVRNIERIGMDHSLSTALRSLQYALSARIRGNMPYRQGAVAAAMAVGDRRFVPAEVTRAYRNTGISHLLVVSGLHLTIITGLLHGLLGRMFKNRRVVSLICIAFILFFMALTGLTASVVRSGIMQLFIYSAGIFRRRADSLNSLGLAAFLLGAANPYAALDMGLLLSFTATLGLIASSAVYARLSAHLQRLPAPAAKLDGPILQNLTGTAMASLATLPVLIAFGAGVSLLTLPFNLLLLPLSPAVIALSLLSALPGIPVLGQLGMLFAWVDSFILGLLDSLTQFFSSLIGIYYYVGGTFALVTCLSVYVLLFLGWHARRLRLYLPAGLLVTCLAVGLHVWLSRDVVTVYPIGYGANPSVLVCTEDAALVLYRSRTTPQQISDALWRAGAQSCTLLVDLRTNPQSTEYVGTLPIEEILVVQHEVTSRRYVSLGEDGGLYLVRQGEGNLAVLDIGGYTVAVPTGHVNLEYYGPVNAIYAGSGRLEGVRCQLLALGSAQAAGADGAEEIAYRPTLFIRPGKSVKIQEGR